MLKPSPPKIKEPRFSEYSGSSYLTKPLFPRYIFARFELSHLYHKIRFTRGIHSLVGFGSDPATVDDSIIEAIRSRAEPNGLVRMNEKFARGDEVIIQHGLLKNLTGIFERNTTDLDRVRILLRTVNFQAHITINRSLLRKVSPCDQQGIQV